MAKIYPAKPFLLLFYGYPGAGKTYFARQFCENVQAAHLQADRIRGELFDQPRYDKQENDIVAQLMDYMAEEFLSAGLSVAYDMNALRGAQRHALRSWPVARHAQPILIWFQIDPETAFSRNQKRDRRRADDKYAAQWDRRRSKPSPHTCKTRRRPKITSSSAVSTCTTCNRAPSSVSCAAAACWASMTAPAGSSNRDW